MNVQVSYFAAFREAAGVSSERIETAAATAEALFAECAGRHPGLQRYSASLVAVNDEMSGWDAALADGDEVLFFPPVAGG
jgi:molybdopterin converting factor small subunit